MIGNRFRFISITVSIIVVTWIIFVIPRGSANYGIDFTGGTKITMNLSREIGMGDLRAKIDGLPASEKDLFKDYTIQTINARESGKASSFSILTRTEEKNIASAQERTDGMPPAPAAPVPAPAPATGAPQAEAATAVAGTATDSRAGTPSPEAMREGVLRRMLTKENLLLPNAFSEAKWEDVAQPSGAQRLVIDANVVWISTEFNMAGTSTTDGMKQALNGYFEKSPNVRLSGSKEATGFKGIRIQAVETVSAPAAAIAGEGSILVTSYRIITDPYTAPAPGAAEARDAPTHPEVVTAVKDWFRQNSKLLTVAEPIPEILSVGPKVAANLQAQAIIAIFFSLLGIMFYMALRFEFMYGVAGVVSLIHDVLITIGIIAVTDALLGDTFSLKINLAEMAAILTIIGFSINDTIVVFDRVRELQKTIKRKLEFTEVINAAVNQTLSRTIWTSLTTLIVTLALLLFGGEPVRGFAFAFAVGIVTGTYSSIFIASPVVVWMHNRQVIHREMLQQEAQKA